VKLPAASEWVFSLKSFVAAMLALYVALRIGLPRPFWAMMTAYIVAHPFAGPVRSKATYRVGGTIIGSLVTIVLVPRFANAPELLSLLLSLWVGICLYVSLLDRTPRSYLFMLAGYTAALIGFPAVGDPAMIFDLALARVEEITLGIVAATLIHSLVFPQSLGPVLLARLDHAVSDARRWIADVLATDDVDGNAARGSKDRHQLAGDITELRLMATHLPFDTSHVRWTANAIYALQERLATMVPLLSGIQDRLHALRQTEHDDWSLRWRTLFNDIAAWSANDKGSTPEQALALRKTIDGMAPAIDRRSGWGQLLEVTLAARLRSLVQACEECRTLRHHIDAGVHGDLPPEAQHQPGLSPRVLHLDHRLALMSALAATIATMACCMFWIVTGWTMGSVAAMMAAIFCCFFATQDDPVPAIKTFMNYTIVSVPISALYLLVLLPAVHSFEMLVLVTAPAFLWMGILIARPASAPKAMATLMGVLGALALQDNGSADMASFLDSMLAQVAGIAAAALITKLLRTVSAEWTARRLLQAGWRELARMGKGGPAPSLAEVSARMLDRIGLLTPRLAMAGPQQDLEAIDTLGDLRVGLNMTQLMQFQSGLGGSQAMTQSLLRQLSEYFEQRPAPATPALLRSLDDTMRAVCAEPASPQQKEAIAALTGIRRGVFPAAPPYQPVHIDDEEIR
jgi:uncharacterized membrane protein YccC